jgi:carbon-monoxide dehydrogenase large subunit
VGADAAAPLAGRWVGAAVRRREDRGLLTGATAFVADLALPGMLQAVFVRAPYAHARIRDVVAQPALAVPGVVAVLTASDVPHQPLVDRVQIAGLRKTPQPALATDRVRFVGEPVAMVVAHSRAAAEDAAERVTVAYDPLPVVVDPEAALAGDAPLLHPELGSNVVYRATQRYGDVDAAFRAADHRFSAVFVGQRYVAAPLEPRGCVAAYEPSTGRLTVWSSTQAPHLLRLRLALTTGIAEHQIRVIAPAVGGGFGQKIPIYPEEVAVALAARALGRPVRWIEDRRENLTAATHAKEQRIWVELALQDDGTFVGLRARFLGNAGAYSFNTASALIEPYLAAGLMPGVYRIPHYEAEVSAVLTNTAPIGPYRGVGWSAGQAARELLIDRVARALGRDPAALRRQNMVRREEFPYRSCTGMVYDSGSFQEALDLALSLVDYERFRAEQVAARAAGRYVGIGISPYVEPTGWGSEGAAQARWTFASHDLVTVTIEPTGKVTVAAGVAPHGQGHETSLAQVAADLLAVPLDDVTVVHSDTATTPMSVAGVRASRTAVVLGGAVALAASDLRAKLLRIASELLEAAPSDLMLADGVVAVKGLPERALTIRQIAEAAYFSPALRAAIPEPHLVATRFYDPKATYANGCIVATVAVDPQTGEVRVTRLVAVEDCGTMINPLIVEGQVHGAVAQGVGGALFEQMVYDAAGQPLTATFMDYALPRATDLPAIEVAHCVSPSPFTVGGIKGMGESGVIATPAAVANAVADALAPLGVTIERLPLTPEAVWRLMRGGAGRSG